MSLSVEFNGTTVEFDESDVTETLNEIDCYDSEVVVEGYDSDGIVYEAIAMMSCDELVEIYEDSILLHVNPSEEVYMVPDEDVESLEWLVENNADDGSWVGR
jgi:hypothetical protein